MRKAWIAGVLAAALVAAGCASSSPSGSGGGGSAGSGYVALVGDSMFASTGQYALAGWLAADYPGRNWFRAANGAGLLTLPRSGSKIGDQPQPSGSWYDTYLVSCCWNDAVAGGHPAQDIIDAIDAFLDRMVAEGVTCARWVLNRDDTQYHPAQAAIWANITFEEFTARQGVLAAVNDHLRARAAQSPIDGQLDLRVVEWGELVESTLVLANMAASGPQPWVNGVWWSPYTDKGVAGSADWWHPYADNVFQTDLDSVHPGNAGEQDGSDDPSVYTGAELMRDLLRNSLTSCPAAG